MDLAKVWDVYGIPSLVVLEKDKEIGRVCQSGSENQSADFSILSRIKIGENMIVTYNKEQVGDVLMLTLKNSGDAKLSGGEKRKVARVTVRTTKKPLPGIFLRPHLSSPSKARAKSFDR